MTYKDKASYGFSPPCNSMTVCFTSRNDSFIYVAWLIGMCDMTTLQVWHDSFVCVTSDLFVCVTWLIHVCGMTLWCIRFICKCVRQAICVNSLHVYTYITHIWVTNESRMSHENECVTNESRHLCKQHTNDICVNSMHVYQFKFTFELCTPSVSYVLSSKENSDKTNWVNQIKSKLQHKSPDLIHKTYVYVYSSWWHDAFTSLVQCSLHLWICISIFRLLHNTYAYVYSSW